MSTTQTRPPATTSPAASPPPCAADPLTAGGLHTQSLCDLAPRASSTGLRADQPATAPEQKAHQRPSLGEFIRQHHVTCSLDELVGAVQALTASFNVRSVAAYRHCLGAASKGGPERGRELLPRLQFWNGAVSLLEGLHRLMCEELERRDAAELAAAQVERQAVLR